MYKTGTLSINHTSVKCVTEHCTIVQIFHCSFYKYVMFTAIILTTLVGATSLLAVKADKQVCALQIARYWSLLYIKIYC